MALNILVVTPQIAFGELIRLTLEETSLYHVRLVQSGSAAMASCDHIPFNLAILDSCLENESLVQLGLNVRAALTGLKVMVIPPANNPHHPLLAGVEPDGFIFQPFYVPDMLDAVAGLLETDVPHPTPPTAPSLPPPWFEDLPGAEQALQNLLPSTSAQDALLIHTRDAFTQSGQLGQTAAREIVSIMARYTGIQVECDFARFIRLSSDGSEHLVYAVPMAGRVLLALVFPPTASLTKISAQTHQMARFLTEQFSPSYTPAAVEAQPEIVGDFQEAQSIPGPASPRKTAELALEDFLSQFPSPQPTPKSQTEARFLFPWEIEAGQPEPLPSALPPLPPAQDEPFRSIEANLNPPSIMESPTRSSASFHIEETQPGIPLGLEDTQPVKVGSNRHPTDQAISNTILANLVYTCILLPRLPEHTLSGDLAHHLAEWMPELCLAFGWQIEGLVI